jgi:hypothetical protein
MCRTLTDETGRSALAQHGPFCVDRCDCGAIHLRSVQSPSELLPLACTELATTLLEGLEHLRPDSTADRAP